MAHPVVWALVQRVDLTESELTPFLRPHGATDDAGLLGEAFVAGAMRWDHPYGVRRLS